MFRGTVLGLQEIRRARERVSMPLAATACYDKEKVAQSEWDDMMTMTRCLEARFENIANERAAQNRAEGVPPPDDDGDALCELVHGRGSLDSAGPPPKAVLMPTGAITEDSAQEFNQSNVRMMRGGFAQPMLPPSAMIAMPVEVESSKRSLKDDKEVVVERIVPDWGLTSLNTTPISDPILQGPLQQAARNRGQERVDTHSFRHGLNKSEVLQAGVTGPFGKDTK